MAATPGPSGPSGASLGAVFTRIEEIKEAASDLYSAYENDVSVVGLAARAGTVRDLAAGLSSALYDIDNALGELA